MVEISYTIFIMEVIMGEVFTLAYIGILTVFAILGVVLICFAIRSNTIQFKCRDKDKLEQLKSQRYWLCIRYVKDDKIIEDELSMNELVKLLDERYKHE